MRKIITKFTIALLLSITIISIIIAPITVIVTALSNPLGAVFSIFVSDFGFDLDEEILLNATNSTGGRVAQIMLSNHPTLRNELDELTDNREIKNKVAITIAYYGITTYTKNDLKAIIDILKNSENNADAIQKISELLTIKLSGNQSNEKMLLKAFETSTIILSGGTSNIEGLTTRLENPNTDPTNPFFFSNQNIFYAAGYVGQCTWYSHARIMEMADELNYPLDKNALNVMSGNGADWYDQALAKQNVFETSNDVTKPRAGAIICWGGGNYGGYPCGHVAVIEKVNEDGTIDITEGWNSNGTIGFAYIPNLSLDTVANRPSKYPGHPYFFKGYIYCIA